jgi:hypothetical protein
VGDEGVSGVTFDHETIEAWSIIKTGQYHLTSNKWMRDCVASTRHQAIRKAMAQTGENWDTLKDAGLEVVKVRISLAGKP